MLAEFEALWSEFAAAEEWSQQALSLMLDGTGGNLVERRGSEPGEHLEAFPHVQIVNEEKGRRRKRGRDKGRERKERKTYRTGGVGS